MRSSHSFQMEEIPLANIAAYKILDIMEKIKAGQLSSMNEMRNYTHTNARSIEKFLWNVIYHSRTHFADVISTIIKIRSFSLDERVYAIYSFAEMAEFFSKINFEKAKLIYGDMTFSDFLAPFIPLSKKLANRQKEQKEETSMLTMPNEPLSDFLTGIESELELTSTEDFLRIFGKQNDLIDEIGGSPLPEGFKNIESLQNESENTSLLGNTSRFNVEGWFLDTLAHGSIPPVRQAESLLNPMTLLSSPTFSHGREKRPRTPEPPSQASIVNKKPRSVPVMSTSELASVVDKMKAIFMQHLPDPSFIEGNTFNIKNAKIIELLQAETEVNQKIWKDWGILSVINNEVTLRTSYLDLYMSLYPQFEVSGKISPRQLHK